MKQICDNERHDPGRRLCQGCCALANTGGGGHGGFGGQKRKTLSGGVPV